VGGWDKNGSYLLERLSGGWSGFNWLKTGTGGSCCEHGDEPLGSDAKWLVICIKY
jgi:hypothetical protein